MEVADDGTNNGASQVTSVKWFGNVGRGEIDNEMLAGTFSGGTVGESVISGVSDRGGRSEVDLTKKMVGKGFFAITIIRFAYLAWDSMLT